MALTWKQIAYQIDVSTADSKAVSAGLVGSAANSSLASYVTAGSTTDSTLTLAASTADSKAVSAGVLAGSHASRHKSAGSDVLLLNEFGLPTGNVAFNGQQATDFVIQQVATSAAITGVTSVLGKIVFAADSLAPWICTAIV